MWEGHDAGEAFSNSDTDTIAGFGTATWIGVEEATLMNVSVAELTPAKFDVAYVEAWDAAHPS